jgi:diguanylate cyclase (GGDEF)-like protein
MAAAGKRFSSRQLVAIAFVGMALLGGGIYFGVNYAVDRAVREDARDKAGHWADYFIAAMPDLDRLIADGRLEPAQANVVETARKLGDVFRFKLYDAAARQVLVSDAIEEVDEESPDHNDEAAEALETGNSEVEVQNGVDGWPELYVEAYVPIAGPADEPRGVVEVYVDQTDTAGLFRTTFAALAIGLAVVAALAFGLPTIGFLLRSRQAKDARERVEYLVGHDPMTGLLNRSALGQALEARLAGPQSADPPVVISFDVDDFQAVNDRFGQAVGDEFLRHVARVCEGVAPAGSLVARPDGDAFVLVAFGLSHADAVALTEAVIQVIGEPILMEGRSVSGDLSAGLYAIDPGTNADEAIHRSGVALAQAKIDGGGVYRVFTPQMEESLLKRRQLEHLIRQAAAEKRFELHFQPLLSADTRRCIGFEALLRLPNGEGGLVQPSDFVPLAESLGLISEIGQWVLAEACRVAVNWPDELRISVNLSVKQFGDGRIVEHVRHALEGSGLRPQRLELEVTESVLTSDTAGVAAQIAALRALGVSIAMDDFGTGYSSLAYLWQFGFDKLKIDRSFVTALERDEAKAREILDSVIVLGHKLNMTVTAEGIETARQAQVLAGLACDQFQGFLFGRPMPIGDIAPFLLNNLGTQPTQAPSPKARSA